MITKIELKSADADFFDLKPLKLLASVSEVQTRYRLDLKVEVTMHHNVPSAEPGGRTAHTSASLRMSRPTSALWTGDKHQQYPPGVSAHTTR